MKSTKLIHHLSDLETKTHCPLLSLQQTRMLFPDESDKTLAKSLARHTHTGLLKAVCQGVWLNPNSRYLTRSNILHQLTALLRPTEFNYVSLESILSEHSIISQQLQGYLTVMTTGRRYTFKTTLGTIEFTHTDQDPLHLLRVTTPIEDSPLRRATIHRAWRDLKRVGRNLDMVDREALEETLADECQVS